MIKERKKFSTKFWELEDIIFNIKLSERKSPTTTLLSPTDDCADSECPLKTASSSINAKNFPKVSSKSRNQIRT